MDYMILDDRAINVHQLINELKALNISNNAFAGVRRSNRKVLSDGSVRVEATHFIEVKLRAAVLDADKRRIVKVVERHVPLPVSPTQLEVLRLKNAAYKRGEGPRLTVGELRELTELTL